MATNPQYLVSTPAALRQLYGPASERAQHKQLARLDEHCRAFIHASPFLTLGTCGTEGADCTPRGGETGFVHVPDDSTLLLPDHRGNNRLDSLLNILSQPAVGLLFFVPGVEETLRVNGNAQLSTDPALLNRFWVRNHAPRTVLVIAVREAFVQCSRALVRAALWHPDSRIDRTQLPSMGTMLAAHTQGRVEAGSYDATLAAQVQATLY